MAEHFLALPKGDQAALLRLHAEDLRMQPFVLEKDIWVCWALDKLFTMPGRLPMAFKGGTSLLKVYRAIDRFSEDIDVTLDYRGFGEEIIGKESRGELIRLSDKLKGLVLEQTRDVIKPYFESVMSAEFRQGSFKVDVSEDGEKVFIHYPAAIEGNDYLGTSVLLEFGGRNITEPNETRTVRSYMSDVVNDFVFPEAEVTVLALPRTYWEKSTLMHVECNRPNPRLSAIRLSRHWYDSYKMSHNLANLQSACAHDLLAAVVKHKKLFFHYGYANYDHCLSGGLRLVPGDELANALDNDFKSMVQAGMFYSEPPAFAEILERLKEVERDLNNSITAHFQKPTN